MKWDLSCSRQDLIYNKSQKKPAGDRSPVGFFSIGLSLKISCSSFFSMRGRRGRLPRRGVQVQEEGYLECLRF